MYCFASAHALNPFTARVNRGEELCKVALTFESVDKILYDVTIQMKALSLPVLSHGTICFSKFYKMKLGNFCAICLFGHNWQ